MYLSHLESGLSSSTLPDATVTTQRIAFLDTLRAVGAICILFHHFALYPPFGAVRSSGARMGPVYRAAQGARAGTDAARRADRAV